MNNTGFSSFAEIEQQLIIMLNRPAEAVLSMTKTERRRLAKLAHRRCHASPIAVPDRTHIRLSCRPYSGPVVIKEFFYYTPFVERAYQRALQEIRDESMKTGVFFIDIIILEKDQVDPKDALTAQKPVVL